MVHRLLALLALALVGEDLTYVLWAAGDAVFVGNELLIVLLIYVLTLD